MTVCLVCGKLSAQRRHTLLPPRLFSLNKFPLRITGEEIVDGITTVTRRSQRQAYVCRSTKIMDHWRMTERRVSQVQNVLLGKCMWRSLSASRSSETSPRFYYRRMLAERVHSCQSVGWMGDRDALFPFKFRTGASCWQSAIWRVQNRNATNLGDCIFNWQTSVSSSIYCSYWHKCIFLGRRFNRFRKTKEEKRAPSQYHQKMY